MTKRTLSIIAAVLAIVWSSAALAVYQETEIKVTDQGRGFDIDRVMARVTSDDPEVLLASGRGILIMRTFLDEVKYEANGRRLIRPLSRGTAPASGSRAHLAQRFHLKRLALGEIQELGRRFKHEIVSFARSIQIVHQDDPAVFAQDPV